MTANRQETNVWMVGGGIASMAAAAVLIRDAGVPGFGLVTRFSTRPSTVFSGRDRAELARLLALPEQVLGARRIDEMFSGHFFETNFWQLWRTTFAFQNWHSAIELRRYFIRFVQEFPRLRANYVDVR